ncbi:MAG: hypothetical protein AAFR11_03900 [Pseudomonadota bacterium]
MPTDAQLKALQAVRDREAGKPVVVNSGDAEECVDKGWLDYINGGSDVKHLRLTELGKKALTSNE